MADHDRSTDADTTTDDQGPRGAAKTTSLPRWKLALLLGSFVVAVGGGIATLALGAGGEEQAAAAPASGMVNSLAPNALVTNADDADPAAEAAPAWAPMLFRLGFGFFAGFCIAYALRTFMKIFLFGCGVALLGMFGLQYAGLIEVDWSSVATRWEDARDWSLAQVSGFGSFVTGYIPSTASAIVGFGLGFRR